VLVRVIKVVRPEQFVEEDHLMLPDYPKIKEKIHKSVNDHIRKLSEQDSFMSTIKAEHHLEGNKMCSITEDGVRDETPYQEFKSEFEIKREDILLKGGPGILIEQAQNVAEEIKKSKSKMIFDKLNEITEHTGNVVQGKGALLNPDMLLEALSKLYIDFDEDGKPSMPSLVVSPEMYAKLQAKIPEWDKNEEYRKKYNDLMEQKKKEWNDRESYRKLVD